MIKTCLMLCAGHGSRFKEVGYELPKPIISILHKPMIEWVYKTLPECEEYIFAFLEEHIKKYQLDHLIEAMTNGKGKVISINKVTRGAAETALLSLDPNKDGDLLIINSDQYIEYNKENFEVLKACDVQGIIFTFTATNPKWSFVEYKHDRIIRVAEKNPISDMATCLHYNTSVLMADGTKRLIGQLVNEKSTAEVVTFNEKLKKFENKKIIGWIKKNDPDVKWYSLSFIDDRQSNQRQTKRVHITGDHKVLTDCGWLRVDELVGNEKIKTRYFAPNSKQLEFIDGTLLGDGFYNRPNNGGELGRYIIKQSKKQEAWFNLKHNLVKHFGGNYLAEPEQERIILGRMSKTSGAYKFSLSSNPVWSQQRERWYPNGTKEVPDDLNLTPLVLAAWYMDDGSLGPTGERLVLCTDCFSSKDTSKLCLQLKEKYNIESKVDRRGRILISNGSVHNGHMSAFRFFDLIAKYIIPEMQYKIPAVFHESFSYDNYIFGQSEILESRVIAKPIDYQDIKSKHPHQYCLQIEDNHNFIAGDMVVSNCGLYYFDSGAKFIQAAKNMIEKNIRTNGEFYLCPVYNELIQSEHKIVPFMVDRMLGIGTPEDLEVFKREIYK